MNEIIEKMAEQCTKIEENPFGMDVVVFDKKKFAELIIQECIDMCDEVDRINKYHIEKDFIDPEWGPTECIDVIKTHFGLKE